MLTKEFKVEGMNCQHCVKSVEIELSELNLSETDVQIGSVKVSFEESVVSEDDIVSAISEAGFKVVK
ncbi:MAG: cation transporter [Bacteroidetes bacterium]|nr:cation transporter [Bacteroidota bacterium]